MKEIGSWLEYTPEFFDLTDNGILRGAELFLSGRAAVEYILDTLGIKVIYIPDYFGDMAAYLKNVPDLVIKEYPVDQFFNLDRTKFEIPKSSPGNLVAFLMVDFFGKRDKAFGAVQSACIDNNVSFIVDRTHSLCNTYAADTGIEFASIRKLLVHLPGAIMRGVTYRDSRRPLDISEPLQSLEKKRQYMESHEDSLKPVYLSEMRELEASLAQYVEHPSALQSDKLATILTSANLPRMAEAHRQNHAALLEALSPEARTRVVPLLFGEGEAPAFFLLECSTEEERNALREHLIQANIYPPIHWLNGTARSSRMLSIPIDHRYSTADMSRVASVMGAFYDSTHG
jgi:hypothetical protein